MKRIAFPVNEKKGLEGTISQHFGNAKFFFEVEIDEATREITGQRYYDNVPHTMGGCMMPVNLLADKGTSFLVVGGIGMRPLMGFMEVGITVMHAPDVNKTIGELVSDLDKLPVIDKSTCGGH